MKKNSLSVSVVIPTYNRERYIRESIESVLEQSYKNIVEIIVVDDGSNDNTKNIVLTFGNRVKYLAIPHSGLPAVPRNAGTAVASGDLIAFQDSDAPRLLTG